VGNTHFSGGEKTRVKIGEKENGAKKKVFHQGRGKTKFVKEALLCIWGKKKGVCGRI